MPRTPIAIVTILGLVIVGSSLAGCAAPSPEQQELGMRLQALGAKMQAISTPPPPPPELNLQPPPVGHTRQHCQGYITKSGQINMTC